MADAGKKKRGKNKSQKTTVSLNEFLADGGSSSPLPPLRSKSWADESAELLDDDLSTQWPDERSHKPQISLSSLPSAPRAATTPNVDITSLPKTPPFTVFLGNLSYDANEDDISKFFEKHKLSVTSVRLVKEKDGRMKGFGYAEFSTRNDLIEALSLTGLVSFFYH
jgi:translation initiation factor 4B